MSKTLPQLPQSDHIINTFDGTGILGMGQVDGYTAAQMQAYALAAIEKDRERQSVPAFDSVRLTRFLTDVVTAAGLLSHGKQSKAVAERVASEAYAIRSMLAAAPQPQPVQQPVAWTDEQMIQFGWMLLCQVNQDDSLEKRLETFRKIMVARNTPHPIKQGPVQQEPVVWLPIETAPKDSSMLRLLVNFDDHSLEDCSEPCWTIGTNALSDTGVDEWLFAGWDWTHDRFTQGTGTPIGWLPMLYTPPQAEQPLSNADGLQISRALHQHGLTLVRTVQGFGVMKLGEITACAATKGTT